MSDYLAPPPVSKIISVTKGCDRSFSLQRVGTDGQPISFDSGSTVYLWVDIASPVKVNATVTGSVAAFTIPDNVCDQVKNSTRFRAVLDLGDLEIPMMVGRFERHDG